MDVEGFEVDAIQGSLQVASICVFTLHVFAHLKQLLQKFLVSYILIEIKSLDDRSFMLLMSPGVPTSNLKMF
jgi:hypothetical protein